MSSSSDSPLAERRQRAHAPQQRSVTAAQVKAYLRRNPHVLRDDPQLLAALTPARYRRDGPVRDFQRYVIGRLRNELADMTDERDSVLEASQFNMETQIRVHDAVLQLVAARNLETLIGIVTRKLAGLIGVDVACLCVEAHEDTGTPPPEHRHGVHVLAPGMVDEILGPEVTHVLRNDVHGSRPLFGPLADKIRSEALIRLSFSRTAPPGLLAIGACDPDMFHPDQGADLLGFLARVLEHCLRRCLDLNAR